MLSLADDQLSHNWEIITEGAAELYIYSFDSEEGVSAWEQHDKYKLSALLSTMPNSTKGIDKVLKKPLRTKNFSIALNELEHQIKAGISNSQRIRKNKPSLLTSVWAGLSGLFSKKSKFTKPTVHFYLPEMKEDTSDAIIVPKALSKWLTGLESKKLEQQVSELLGNLIPLNRVVISTPVRFKLLECYLPTVKNLLHSQLLKGSKISSDSHTNYIKTVHAHSLLIDELTIGYKIIINEYFHQAKHPNSNIECLIATNRLAEYLGISILFSYSHYLAIPNNALNNLHQLYLYNEYYHTLNKIPSLKDAPTSHSFSHFYNTILLMGIANPFRLERHEVSILHNLMATFSEQITLVPLSKSQSNTATKLTMAGAFCIDTSSNRTPLSLAEITAEVRELPQSRLLDTQNILESIEQSFQQETSSNTHDIDAVSISLLKKVVPQFNATYTRRYKRTPCEGSPKTNIEIGLSAIHVSLINGSSSQVNKWTIHNRDAGGMMISSNAYDDYHLNIGDSIGIFENKARPVLAIIRWIVTDKEGITRLGLEIIRSSPKAVSLMPKNKSEILLGILLPASGGTKPGTTILVEKGTYLSLQELDVSEGNLHYKISVDTLMNNSFNDVQFNFTVKD